ncbi:MAG: V-type ATP synthase subunit K [Eubacteriales bacterium]|jgi:V/A-type H+-transporting ATPase subunit K|nr:V-type ATP synthase subunit K [Eubacteriales bacterium]MDD4104871.1 V-type ATP synthase subunit K [Eubacteriales bacterium]MDD4711353.1 V-type ATP synthase subunit K [Eubacteriales bacterium]
MELQLGQFLALLGAAIAVILSGIGSSRGVGLAGETATGVATENPEITGKLLVLQLLPATQGIYGFLIGVIVLINTGVLGGQMVDVSVAQGLKFLAGCLPIGFVGLESAIQQAKVCAGGMLMTGQHPEMSGRGITMAVMVETYAVFALLISFLIVNSIMG